MNLARRVGQITLWTLIGFALASLVVFAIEGMWYWFATIGGCFACVLIGEAVSFIVKKKSISSQYGEWIKRSPVLAIVALACFGLAMVSLVVHLAAYGLR